MDHKPKAPTTRHRFANAWAELDYLCKKISYWLYIQSRKAKALRYSDRLERVLRKLPENDLAIIREEGLALLCELQGKTDEAIAHRTREIQLIERLHQSAQSEGIDESTRAYMLRDRDASALKRRRMILRLLERANASTRNNRDVNRDTRPQRRGVGRISLAPAGGGNRRYRSPAAGA